MKTTLPKDPGTKREWLLVDATDKTVGRLAVKIANILRGKTKPTFSPQVDTGAFVVVINAEKIKLTGRKEEQKIYQRYSGYRSGLKEMTAATVRERHPERLITLAVRGMLPKNAMGRKVIKRLKAYAGPEHPHQAQPLQAVEL
ncbi:50S ribosomal protein L13 [Verrucomicrobiota bacterium]